MVRDLKEGSTIADIARPGRDVPHTPRKRSDYTSTV
jgi:hypothetical protein